MSLFGEDTAQLNLGTHDRYTPDVGVEEGEEVPTDNVSEVAATTGPHLAPNTKGDVALGITARLDFLVTYLA
jgi:hypothetical protein